MTKRPILRRLRLPECSSRYNREDLFEEQKQRQQADRERFTAHICWLFGGFAVLAFAAVFIADAWAWTAQS